MTNNVLADVILDGEKVTAKLAKRIQACQDRVDIIYSLNQTLQYTSHSLDANLMGLSDDLQAIKQQVSSRCHQKHFAELEKLFCKKIE